MTAAESPVQFRFLQFSDFVFPVLKQCFPFIVPNTMIRSYENFHAPSPLIIFSTSDKGTNIEVIVN